MKIEKITAYKVTNVEIAELMFYRIGNNKATHYRVDGRWICINNNSVDSITLEREVLALETQFLEAYNVITEQLELFPCEP